MMILLITKAPRLARSVSPLVLITQVARGLDASDQSVHVLRLTNPCLVPLIALTLPLSASVFTKPGLFPEVILGGIRATASASTRSWRCAGSILHLIVNPEK